MDQKVRQVYADCKKHTLNIKTQIVKSLKNKKDILF